MKFVSLFYRQVATLASGTVLAQLIPVLISPLLTRIYSPGEFGVFALYVSIVVLFTSIMTLRYEMAIVLPKEDNDAISLFHLSVFIAFLISALLLVFFLLFNNDIAFFLNAPQLSEYLLLVPLVCMTTAIYQSFSHWCNRTSQYKKIAVSRVSNSFVMSAIQLVLGAKFPSSPSLISGHLIGQAVALMVIAWRWGSNSIFTFKIDLERIKKNAKKYKDFPFFNTPHAFVDSSRDLLVNIFLIMLSTASSVGIFMLVNRVMLAPVSVIGNAISQVLFRKLSEEVANKNPITEHISKVVKVTFLIACVPTLIVGLFGLEIFSFVFGGEWANAGEVARYFSIYSFFHFSATILSIIPIVLEKQRAAFFVNLIYTFCYIGSLVIGLFLFKDMLAAVQFFSGVMAVYFFASFIWLYGIVSDHDKGLL